MKRRTRRKSRCKILKQERRKRSVRRNGEEKEEGGENKGEEGAGSRPGKVNCSNTKAREEEGGRSQGANVTEKEVALV